MIEDLGRNYSFEERLAHLLNEFSKENSSDTPDFVLANYLEQCLTAFNLATHRREQFYGRDCPGGVKGATHETVQNALTRLKPYEKLFEKEGE